MTAFRFCNLNIPDESPAIFATSSHAFFFVLLSLKSLDDLSLSTGKRLTASAIFSSKEAAMLLLLRGPENKHCDWFILPLTTPTMKFSLHRKRQSHKRNRKEMETF